MTDSALRQAERAWRRSGAPSDEITYLAARLRTGQISRDRLDLAAYCGHVGAQQLLAGEMSWWVVYNAHGHRVSPHIPGFDDAWVRGLVRWGHEVTVRASVAAAWTAFLSLLCFECRRVGFKRLDCRLCLSTTVIGARRVIEAAEVWLTCPCDLHVHEWNREWLANNAHGWLPPVWEGIVWIIVAGRAAGEDAVRGSISRALIPWALA